MENNVRMVIGSWGSYNECNKRALGSKWLDLSDYEDWNEIVKELESQGFELNGIDEELFVQDIEGIPTEGVNWEYTHPKTIFNLLKQSGVLDDEYKFEIMQAYLEVRSFKEWEGLIEKYEDSWDMDIYLYTNQSMIDVAYNIVEECYNLEGPLANYFDYEAFARDLSYDGYTETTYGVLEIR